MSYFVLPQLQLALVEPYRNWPLSWRLPGIDREAKFRMRLVRRESGNPTDVATQRLRTSPGLSNEKSLCEISCLDFCIALKYIYIYIYTYRGTERSMFNIWNDFENVYVIETDTIQKIWTNESVRHFQQRLFNWDLQIFQEFLIVFSCIILAIYACPLFNFLLPYRIVQNQLHRKFMQLFKLN